jgi:glutathione S-transferase
MNFGSNPDMAWIAVVVALALLQLAWLGFSVGAARGKYGVEAPATSGNEIWERHNRVHQNTIEQLITFLPAILLFGLYMDAKIGAGLGLLFIAGRFVYASAYIANPSSRTIGFVMTFAATMILLIGGLIGAIQQLM